MKETLEKINKDFDEKVERINQERAYLVKKLSMLGKYGQKKPETDEEKQELLSVLCYGSLGYCCGLEKKCMWRDSVLAVYNIDPKVFKAYKEEVGNVLLEEPIKSGGVLTPRKP